MINHILRTLGLPKRTEINTNQTPALRRIAGLEDEVESLQEQQTDVILAVQHLEGYVKELETSMNQLCKIVDRCNEFEKAIVQMRMILDDMQPKPAKPARKPARRAKP